MLLLLLILLVLLGFLGGFFALLDRLFGRVFSLLLRLFSLLFRLLSGLLDLILSLLLDLLDRLGSLTLTIRSLRFSSWRCTLGATSGLSSIRSGGRIIRSFRVGRISRSFRGARSFASIRLHLGLSCILDGLLRFSGGCLLLLVSGLLLGGLGSRCSLVFCELLLALLFISIG